MQYMMDLDSKRVSDHTEKEKEWNNPVEPANTSDERDKEQLIRQYKEAKRRKDNLNDDDQTKEKNLNL